jgi:ribosomal protein L37AE/L43A
MGVMKAALTRPKRSSPVAGNVIPFPLHRREMQGCPHCGRRSGVWRIGRLLWACCDTHEVRWVAADLTHVPPGGLDRRELTKGLELLAAYDEVSR